MIEYNNPQHMLCTWHIMLMYVYLCLFIYRYTYITIWMIEFKNAGIFRSASTASRFRGFPCFPPNNTHRQKVWYGGASPAYGGSRVQRVGRSQLGRLKIDWTWFLFFFEVGIMSFQCFTFFGTKVIGRLESFRWRETFIGNGPMDL